MIDRAAERTTDGHDVLYGVKCTLCGERLGILASVDEEQVHVTLN